MLASLLAGAVLLGLLGCGPEAPAEPPAPQVTRGTGRVSGVVLLRGTPPPPRETTIACDPRPGARTMVHIDRTIVVGEGGALVDVYVYVVSHNGQPLRGSGRYEPARILDQIDCYFIPQALAVQIDQPIRLRNSDPTFHNVHWDPQRNAAVNFGFLPYPAGGERIVALRYAEFISVRCDVHPWMTSTIGVFDHPFFATTDAQGRFVIEGLPAGRFELSVWHAHYGRGETVSFTIGEGESAEANFEFVQP